MIEQTYEDRDIPIYSVKGSQKFRDIQARIQGYSSKTAV